MQRNQTKTRSNESFHICLNCGKELNSRRCKFCSKCSVIMSNRIIHDKCPICDREVLRNRKRGKTCPKCRRLKKQQRENNDSITQSSNCVPMWFSEEKPDFFNDYTIDCLNYAQNGNLDPVVPLPLDYDWIMHGVYPTILPYSHNKHETLTNDLRISMASTDAEFEWQTDWSNITYDWELYNNLSSNYTKSR